MAAVSKKDWLDALEIRVESHLQEAVRVFQNTPTEILLKPAATGGWSIAQCLQHLNAYGHYYLPQIQKGLLENKNLPDNPVFSSTWFGRYFTRMMDPETGQKKYKAFKDYTPTPDLDAYVVVAEFIQQQEKLINYLESARTTGLNKIKIPISIAKWLKLRLGDTLAFLIAHNHRHVLQAKRNLA